MKLATFISRNFSNLLAISESSLKEILGYIRLFFVILLTLAIICKQILLHETRFCNIFKTVSAIMLTKTILESPYKVLQGS